MLNDSILAWLLQGDVSVQYQTQRDLLHADTDTLLSLQSRIAGEGFGAAYLALRHPDGHWGQSFYQPKWTSTHYTLLELRNLCAAPDHPDIRASVQSVFDREKGNDGGINPHRSLGLSDVCINGMAMHYGCYFGISQDCLRSVVDFVLSQWMPDGGFNCMSNRKGAVHSSLHTTLSVAEGITDYQAEGYAYRLPELLEARRQSVEFMLAHRLYQSHRTGETIDPKMLMLSYPGRWRYDILHALDCLRVIGIPYDPRMEDALAVLRDKQRADGTWPLQSKHPGEVYFDMEQAGKPSRWNTLRALRVLSHFCGNSTCMEK